MSNDKRRGASAVHSKPNKCELELQCRETVVASPAVGQLSTPYAGMHVNGRNKFLLLTHIWLTETNSFLAVSAIGGLPL